ncbi:hypothetical protein HanRHA438_Chr10g0473571 [Helianthus annuus]|nr:hypothetical protein HanRHA438_Chr10g0473571 [Helianthus annuus]
MLGYMFVIVFMFMLGSRNSNPNIKHPYHQCWGFQQKNSDKQRNEAEGGRMVSMGGCRLLLPMIFQIKSTALGPFVQQVFDEMVQV